MHPADAVVRSLITSLVDAGLERGAQVCAYHEGQVVVDCVAGFTEPTNAIAVTPETLFPVYSVGKGVTATIVHRFVERGLIDVDAAVANYWPEFAANGKSLITLRHVLSHTAGIPLMPDGVDLATVCDWDAMAAAIARLTPVSAPGAEVRYHAMTWGWPVGEVLRRVSGSSVTQLVRDEICRPLGITNLHIGLPADYVGPIALLEDRGLAAPELPPEIPVFVRPLDALMNRANLRQACVPASNCLATARALAKLFASLLPGGVDGVELLPPYRVKVATAVPIIDGKPSRFALGYSLGGGVSPMGDSSRAFGHAGYGGSLAFADPTRRLAIAVTRNRLRDLSQVDTARLVCQAIRNAISA